MEQEQQKKVIHQRIIESVDTLVGRRISEINTTNSTVGVVVENPSKQSVKVQIHDDIFDCMINEHLFHWIQKDDIVIVQDLHNDRKKMNVVGKTGHISNDPQLVFEDPRAQGNYISGVDGVFDENGTLLNYATVDTEGYGVNPPDNEEDDGNDYPIYKTIQKEYSVSNVKSYILNNKSGKQYPYVLIINDTGNIVNANIKYSGGIIDITFEGPFTGKIIIDELIIESDDIQINETIIEIKNAVNQYFIANTTDKKYPIIIVVDNDGNVVKADIKYESRNSIYLYFDEMFTGNIILI